MTRIAEVGAGTFQISTYFEEMDFSMNQYLVVGDEPLLFHVGMRSTFDAVRGAVAEVIDPTTLRWLSFGHVEADECGAVNEWLAQAPNAEVAFGQLGCMLTVGDIADRPPRPLADGETVGPFRWIDTPHVPHGWEAGLVFDEYTRTLFCGDLLAVYGAFEPTTVESIAAAAIDAEDAMPSMSLHPETPAVIRRLAALEPAALAPMHGPVVLRDCAAELERLAVDAERRIGRLAGAGA